jgi:hypothetical protein
MLLPPVPSNFLLLPTPGRCAHVSGAGTAQSVAAGCGRAKSKSSLYYTVRGAPGPVLRSGLLKRSTELVGRLGFEPRQSASKALDLPLVDRPVSTVQEAGSILCEDRIPVSRARQGLRQDRPRAVGLHTMLRLARRRLICIEAKQRRARAR